VSSPSTRRRRRGQHETQPQAITPPAEPTPDRGATLNLQDPDAYIAWLASNADGFQLNGEQLREKSRDLWAAAAEHDRQVQTLDGQIKDIQDQLKGLEARREAEQQAREMRAAEAKQNDDRTQNSENAAADIQTSIPVIQQAVANGSGQSPATTAIDLDPKDAARIDGAISRIDALRAELSADQRDEGEL